MSVAAEPRHVSVLPQEVIKLLDPQPGEVWVDATTGAGGHTRQIAERVGPNGHVFALDQDAKMLELAATRLAGLPVRLIQANFDQLLEVLARENITQVNGLLADLGFCSDQLDDATRGLSFREDGPLDMRLDTSTGQTAAELVNTMSEEGLADVFYEFGEERKSRWVAKRIVERRREQKFSRTGELAELVRSTVPRSGGIDPATRVFQALRIAVNDELGALDRLLGMLPEIVATGGRVGMISFHSLEDRRVKQAFRDQAFWSVRTKKPVEASEAEVARNPRSRSAKFRVAVRSG
jgi:16S rRNA (cytosine1402-N4)-methyltransferase